MLSGFLKIRALIAGLAVGSLFAAAGLAIGSDEPQGDVAIDASAIAAPVSPPPGVDPTDGDPDIVPVDDPAVADVVPADPPNASDPTIGPLPGVDPTDSIDTPGNNGEGVNHVSSSKPSMELVEMCRERDAQQDPNLAFPCEVIITKYEGDLPPGDYTNAELREALDASSEP